MRQLRVTGVMSPRDRLWSSYSSSGAIIGIFGVSRDVTERRRSEATIQRQLAEITSYYTHAPIGLCALTKDKLPLTTTAGGLSIGGDVTRQVVVGDWTFMGAPTRCTSRRSALVVLPLSKKTISD